MLKPVKCILLVIQKFGSLKSPPIFTRLGFHFGFQNGTLDIVKNKFSENRNEN